MIYFHFKIGSIENSEFKHTNYLWIHKLQSCYLMHHQYQHHQQYSLLSLLSVSWWWWWGFMPSAAMFVVAYWYGQMLPLIFLDPPFLLFLLFLNLFVYNFSSFFCIFKFPLFFFLFSFLTLLTFSFFHSLMFHKLFWFSFIFQL